MPMGRTRKSNFGLPPRMHVKGDTFYYVTTTSPRKWIRLSKDLQEAKVKWAEIEGRNDESGLFSALVHRYLAECLGDLKPNTVRAYRSAAAQIIKVFGEMRPEEIKPPHIAQYMDLHDSKSKANMGLVVLKNVFLKAIRWGAVETSPAMDIERHTLKRRERYITDEEFTAIRSKASAVVRCAMDIAYLTGAREGDILKIKLGDIKPDGLYITQEKTGKNQVFTWTEPLSAAINAARKLPRRVRGFTLICTRTGKQYTTRNFYSQWEKACEKAGVTDAHFHDLRGKAATDAKLGGQNHQQLLGHSNKAMSDSYIKLPEFERVEPLRKKL